MPFAGSPPSCSRALVFEHTPTKQSQCGPWPDCRSACSVSPHAFILAARWAVRRLPEVDLSPKPSPGLLLLLCSIGVISCPLDLVGPLGKQAPLHHCFFRCSQVHPCIRWCPSITILQKICSIDAKKASNPNLVATNPEYQARHCQSQSCDSEKLRDEIRHPKHDRVHCDCHPTESL
jgi:hypothetical protein